MNFSGMRQLNLVPFSQILRYIQAFREGNPDGMKLFFSDVIFFIPIGFFLSGADAGLEAVEKAAGSVGSSGCD